MLLKRFDIPVQLTPEELEYIMGFFMDIALIPDSFDPVSYKSHPTKGYIGYPVSNGKYMVERKGITNERRPMNYFILEREENKLLCSHYLRRHGLILIGIICMLLLVALTGSLLLYILHYNFVAGWIISGPLAILLCIYALPLLYSHRQLVRDFNRVRHIRP